MSIKSLTPDKLLVDVSVRVLKKQHRREITVERNPMERTQDFRARAGQVSSDTKASLLKEFGPDAIARKKGTKTVKEIVAQYYDSRKRSFEPSTDKSFHSRVAHWLTFCQERSIVYIDQFTRAEAQKYWDWLIDKGFVGSGPAHKFEVVTSVIQYELDEPERVINSHPCKNITRHSITIEEDVKPMPDDMYQAFMSSCRSTEERMAFQMLAGTGCRAGELRNLPTVRVLPRGVIRIAPYKKWKPKTHKSKRLIPETHLSTEAINYFLEINGDKEYLLGGSAPLGPNWFIHRFDDLRQIVAKRYPEFADEILSKRDGGKRFWYSTHSLRKNFTTWGLESGIAMEAIGPILGHSHSYMTQKYGKPGEAHLTSVVTSKFNDRITIGKSVRPLVRPS